MGTKRKKGRKKEENERKREKKGKGKENCYPVIFFGLGKRNQALNELENT